MNVQEMGCFSNFGRVDDVTRAMSNLGGGACGYLCKISGKSTPLPPLTKAFPYAYAETFRPQLLCLTRLGVDQARVSQPRGRDPMHLGSPNDFRGVARLSTNLLKNDIRTEKCWPNSPTYSTDVGVLRGWGRAQITVRHFGSRGKKG